MKAIKWIVPALVLGLGAVGCILISGQFLIDFELPNFQTQTSSTIVAQEVDLNDLDQDGLPDSDSEYKDHKSELQDLVDLAVLGKVTNHGNEAVGVEVWMTPTITTYTNSTQISQNATKIWGPFVVLPGATKKVGWDESADLFADAGKKLLVQEIKGDGQFTVYAIGSTTNYNFSVENGVLALVLDFGK